MIAELLHFARHLPSTSMMAAKLSQVDLYDAIMLRGEQHGMRERRRWLARGLRGSVLEIGSGTGLMFDYYTAEVELTALEPDAAFRERSVARALAAAANTTLVAGHAEALPFPDAHFDAVVASLVLCSVDSIPRALTEVRRVAKPGATIRLLEHVCSDLRVAKVLMHALNPLWRAVNRQGCNMNRTVLPHFAAAGLEVSSVEADQLWVPGVPAFPLQRIEAAAMAC